MYPTSVCDYAMSAHIHIHPTSVCDYAMSAHIHIHLVINRVNYILLLVTTGLLSSVKMTRDNAVYQAVTSILMTCVHKSAGTTDLVVTKKISFVASYHSPRGTYLRIQ